ncbi:hypothetical protein [Spiroplasma syrphidicola]|nr:hypothetical protein [Spiroplasma syrphidicola]
MELQNGRKAWEIMWPRFVSKTIVTTGFLLMTLVIILVFGSFNPYVRVDFIPYFSANYWSLFLIDLAISNVIIFCTIFLKSYLASIISVAFGLFLALNWLITAASFTPATYQVSLTTSLKEKFFAYNVQQEIKENNIIDNYIRGFYADNLNPSKNSQIKEEIPEKELKQFYGMCTDDGITCTDKYQFQYDNFGKNIHLILNQDQQANWNNNKKQITYDFNNVNSQFGVNYEYNRILNNINKISLSTEEQIKLKTLLDIAKSFFDTFLYKPSYQEWQKYGGNLKTDQTFYNDSNYSPGESQLMFALQEGLKTIDKGILPVDEINLAQNSLADHFKINPLFWILNFSYGALSTSINNKYLEFPEVQFYVFNYVDMNRNPDNGEWMITPFVYQYNLKGLKSTSSYLGNAIAMLLLTLMTSGGVYLAFNKKLRI